MLLVPMARWKLGNCVPIILSISCLSGCEELLVCSQYALPPGELCKRFSPVIVGVMFALRYSGVMVVIVAGAVGFFVYKTQTPEGRFAFKLGLDLSGGTHLVYNADTSKLPAVQISDSMSALQQVIERRVNAFGVGEPLVQTEQGGALGGGGDRLIVELPGVA